MMDKIVIAKMCEYVNFFYPLGILKKILEFITINGNKEIIWRIEPEWK
jgi:hypothetical protein